MNQRNRCRWHTAYVQFNCMSTGGVLERCGPDVLRLLPGFQSRKSDWCLNSGFFGLRGEPSLRALLGDSLVRRSAQNDSHHLARLFFPKPQTPARNPSTADLIAALPPDPSPAAAPSTFAVLPSGLDEPLTHRRLLHPVGFLAMARIGVPFGWIGSPAMPTTPRIVIAGSRRNKCVSADFGA